MVLLLGSILCGDGATSQASGVQGTIRFSWWGTGERNRKTMAVIDLFQKQYPAVTVQGEPVGDFTTYWQKLTVEASARNLPCVPQMQTPYLDQYASRHALLALDSLVKSGAIDVSGIPEIVLNSGRGSDGQLYMISTTTSASALMYNATMLEKASLPPLSSNLTWEQLQAWLLAAKSKLPPGVYPIDLSGGFDAPWTAWVVAHGQPLFKGRRLGFSKQTMSAYWSWWEKLREAGATVTASMMAVEPTGNEQLYITLGKVMVQQTPANALGQIQAAMTANNLGTVKLATYPKGPSGITGAKSVHSGLSIGANCSNIPAAATFINFWTNDSQGAKVYASDNGAVSVTKLLNAQIADLSMPPETRQALSFVKQVISLSPPNVQYISGYSAVIDSLNRNYASIAFGRATIEQAVNTFFSEANRALAQP